MTDPRIPFIPSNEQMQEFMRKMTAPAAGATSTHHPNCSFPIYECQCDGGKTDPALYFPARAERVE